MFQCQRDSYLQHSISRVISCEEATLGDIRGYEVVLEDTVLFPEGGGQPDDRGMLAGREVLRVTRQGGKAVHFVTGDSPLEVGGEVEMSVDWERRFDHMQQHSGQHLITAITDQLYGYKTTSWNLSIGKEHKCHIELSTGKMREEEVRAVEEKCNQCIRNRIPMTPRWLSPNAPELEEVRSRGLPDDFVGQKVRVVDIEGIDSNMCCGTHVSNLADIQCIHLLYTENKRGSTLLYYVAGSRVMLHLSHAVNVERRLNKLLSVGQEEHCEAVDRLLKSSKQMSKVVRTQLREIAQLTALKHLSTLPVEPLACFHRDDGDVEFMNTLASELADKCVLVMVTVGADKGSGHFLLAGDDQKVAQLGPKVAEVLCGKGGGRKGRYQGKASKIQAREEARGILLKALQQQPPDE